VPYSKASFRMTMSDIDRLSEICNDSKHHAASLRELSFLLKYRIHKFVSRRKNGHWEHYAGYQSAFYCTINTHYRIVSHRISTVQHPFSNELGNKIKSDCLLLLSSWNLMMMMVVPESLAGLRHKTFSVTCNVAFFVNVLQSKVTELFVGDAICIKSFYLY